VLILDIALLLLPLHAEGRIGEHIVESPFLPVAGPVEAVLGEGVAQDDGVCILAFDEHVGLADGPGFVVPVLTEELGLGVAVEVADVFFRDGQHAARAAGGIVDGFDDVAAGEVFLRREEEIDHELYDLAGGEMLPGLLVRLLCADANEFLEDIAHLDVVHALGREVHRGELLDHEVEQVFLSHLRDLRIEAEPLHDGADVGREAVDVGADIGGDLAGARIVKDTIEPATLRRLGEGEL
jgi:hypothetical protein